MTPTPSDGSCLAIDFGTTETAAALSMRGSEQLVEVDGSPRMPSIVCWKASSNGEAGRLLLGEAAENEAALAPHRVERCPKRKLGQEFMLLGDACIRMTDAVAQIFLHVLGEATAREGGRAPGELRLTHPAQWGQVKLAKLREAASAAGFPDAELLPEPVGAAVYFADERLGAGEHVAVYDLGGGTFDTAVLLRTNDGFEVVGKPGGREDLGGEDFDDRLYRFLGAQLDPDHWLTLTAEDAELRWQRAHHDFRREVRRAKERLSKYVEATVRSPVPGLADLRVSRTEFESLIRADVADTIDELARTIQTSGQSPDTLSAIYLAGGSSRIPLVSTVIEDCFGRPPSVLGDPKAVIALGAARAYAQRVARPAGSNGPNAGGAPNGQVVVRADKPVRPDPPAKGPSPSSSPPRSRPGGAAATKARPLTAHRSRRALPRGPDRTAVAATGIFSGTALLGAAAGALLLIDAAKRGAPAGIGIAAGAGLVGWLLLAAGFATACAALSLTSGRTRVTLLRDAALVGVGGFSAAFLSELSNVAADATHGASSALVAAHGAVGGYDLLAALAAAIAAAALASGTRRGAARTNGSLAWAGALAGASFLMWAIGSILDLVTYRAGATEAALSAGIGAQIAGSALAAGGALIVTTAFMDGHAGSSKATNSRLVISIGLGLLALGFGIVALGGGMQAAIGCANGLDGNAVAAAWLDTGRQAGWAVALGCAAFAVSQRQTRALSKRTGTNALAR